MVESIICGFDEFEFVLDVALIVFLLERSDDLIFGVVFDGGFRGIHEFDEIFEIHFHFFGLEQVMVYFDD